MNPLCLAWVPFGRLTGSKGASIGFEAVYDELIVPAIRQSGMEPLRAGEGQVPGILHEPVMDRFMLCDCVLVDVTSASADVFFEIGLRNGERPGTTVVTFAEGHVVRDFDRSAMRAVPYGVGMDGRPSSVEDDRRAITRQLREARHHPAECSLYRMAGAFPDIQRLKTDVFRQLAHYDERPRTRLSAARRRGRDAVRAVEDDMGSVADASAGAVIDLYLSYRAVKAWPDMIGLVRKMSPPLAYSVLVREQLGLALNRAGQSEAAEEVLLEVIQRRGPSSETFGLLGRVYKDRWEAATRSRDDDAARAWLDKAIEAYLSGFETDWRDGYPGINAVTLMEVCEPPDERRHKIIPVVAYAVERRIASGKADYWDHATRLELSVLTADPDAAKDALAKALSAVREPWELESTAGNLRLIREARERRGTSLPWSAEIERILWTHDEGRAQRNSD